MPNTDLKLTTPEKSWYDKLVDFLLGKQFILFSFSILILIFFHEPIEILLNKTVVKYGLKYVYSSGYNDTVIIAISIYTIFLTIVRGLKGYTPSKRIVLILLAASCTYLIYRTFNLVWDFTPLTLSTYIYYADTLLLISACSLFLSIKSIKWNDPKLPLSTLLCDSPLTIDSTDVDPDKLGYRKYAHRLADKINSSQFEKAFAIGINGKWGAGKTSFFNLLKSQLNKKNTIVVNFDPWNSNSPNAIIQDFFETVETSIRPYHSTLARLLLSYSSKLASLNDNMVAQSVQTSISAFSGYDSINTLFNDIDIALKSVQKKLIIFIDDIDRLDENEIIEVLRLIRNTANFYNTFFIVAYDRSYVINAIKNHSSHRQEYFLEKIFQLEVTLPHFKRHILADELAAKLIKRFPDYKETISKAILGPDDSSAFHNDWIENLRDVTRLANSLILNLEAIWGEVLFVDFLNLEILRIKFPAVYELLYKKTDDYLTLFSDDGSSKGNQYKLQKTKNDSGEEFFKLELFLTDNHNEYSVPKKDIKSVVYFINTIFYTGYDWGNAKHELSVIYPSKFNRYFAYTLFEENLSTIEFSKARSLTQDAFNDKITEWVNKDLESELRDQFMWLSNFDNKQDFEKVIRAIFYFANLSSKRPNYEGKIGYDGSNLFQKLNNSNKRLSRLYYQDDTNGLETFVSDLFKLAELPYNFESDFISYVVKQDNVVSFPLNRESLTKIAIEYLRQYCSMTTQISPLLFQLYYNCSYYELVQVQDNTYQQKTIIPPDARKLIIDFIIKKDLDAFLIEKIDMSYHEQERYAIDHSIRRIFGTWDIFEKSLPRSNKSWKYLKEFKQLYKFFKATGYNGYSKIKFKDIDLSSRITQP